jgi:hypothetical protein
MSNWFDEEEIKKNILPETEPGKLMGVLDSRAHKVARDLEGILGYPVNSWWHLEKQKGTSLYQFYLEVNGKKISDSYMIEDLGEKGLEAGVFEHTKALTTESEVDSFLLSVTRSSTVSKELASLLSSSST